MAILSQCHCNVTQLIFHRRFRSHTFQLRNFDSVRFWLWKEQKKKKKLAKLQNTLILDTVIVENESHHINKSLIFICDLWFGFELACVCACVQTCARRILKFHWWFSMRWILDFYLVRNEFHRFRQLREDWLGRRETKWCRCDFRLISKTHFIIAWIT